MPGTKREDIWPYWYCYLKRILDQYGLELNERIRKYSKLTKDSWRVDETYLKIKGKNLYLYFAVNSKESTLDFYLSQRRSAKATKHFLKKALAFYHIIKPRTSRLMAITFIQLWFINSSLLHDTSLHVKKYLNNIAEQHHWFIKKRLRNRLRLKAYQAVRKMIDGIKDSIV